MTRSSDDLSLVDTDNVERTTNDDLRAVYLLLRGPLLDGGPNIDILASHAGDFINESLSAALPSSFHSLPHSWDLSMCGRSSMQMSGLLNGFSLVIWPGSKALPFLQGPFLSTAHIPV